MLLIETSAVVLVVVIGWIYPTFGSNCFSAMEQRFTRLAHRRRLSVAIVGLASLGLRLVLLPVLPVPEPIIQDEFAYLLAADTFAHGRLANPTSEMWVHFETFGVIHQPTYCSKYFPAQGLVLAMGKVLFGHPIWGVWLSASMMCAAITWMLQGWLAPEWALLGGLLAVLRFGVFSYWANSYWGGAIAAIGGALVLGALPRLRSFLRPSDAALMGLGLVLLATSRPWEGLVLGLAVGGLLLAWLARKKQGEFKIALRRAVMPQVLMLVVSTVWLGYYCWRTTGNPFVTPYQVHDNMYAVSPYMLWQHVRTEPVYRHETLRKAYAVDELAGYHTFLSPVGLGLQTYEFWSFFLGPALTAPYVLLAVALPFGFSWRKIAARTRTLLLLLLAFVAGAELAVFHSPHYFAPITSIIIALSLIALRRIRHWNSSGLFIGRALPFVCVLTFVLRAAAGPLHIPIPQFRTWAWHQQALRGFSRQQFQTELERTPGNHLVIVHYGPGHKPLPEWVYNDADIDHAKVIWAREMGAAKDHELINYYPGRTIWLLDADGAPPKLEPYVHPTVYKR